MRPAVSNIRNENILWPRKLRVFSTPHAWFTAVLMAPNTPSAPQTSRIPPPTPRRIGFWRNASTCALMKSNCPGKYRSMNISTFCRVSSSAVTLPSIDTTMSAKGNIESSA